MFEKFNWLWDKKNFLNFRLVVLILILISAAVGVYFVYGNTAFKNFSFYTHRARADSVGITATVELTVQPACHDGIDNDGDGLMDYPNDPGCDDIYDTDEYNAPACNDGIDNDSDGLIDYPDDPGCSSLNDTDEYDAPSPPGGGGGAPLPTPQTLVILKGKAYPLTKVNVLKDGQIATVVDSDTSANFEVQITDITTGVHTLGVWAEDKDKRKSLTFSFTANIISGMTTTISGILLPPTIDINKTQVDRGDVLNILGQTAPQSEINIHINSPQEIIEKVKAESDGTWFLAFNTSPLDEGQHSTKARAITLDNWQSIFSQVLSFIVGKGMLPTETCPKADLNKDGKVNLIDFSILMYWWGKANACADQNRDELVNLPDFSIMMYWWTG